MAIKTTPLRGIPYPDGNENVDDAKHWVAAMAATDVQIDQAQRAAIQSSIAAIPPLARDAAVEAVAAAPSVVAAAEAAVEGAAAGLDLVTGSGLRNSLMGSGVYGSSAASDTHQQTSTELVMANDQTVIVDPGANTVTGAQFFTPIRVGNKPGTWLDEYYGYASGHGAGTEVERIWLVTAPSITGPWTWQQPVIGATNSDAPMKSTLVGPDRTIAPEALWVNGEIYIYYHGLTLATGYGAPEVLAKSADGINFTEHGIVLPIDAGTTDSSPYEASKSYLRVIKDGAIFHAIWQGNGTKNNSQLGGLSTYTVGHATSMDGVRWRPLPPLIVPAPGDQGIMSPGLVKVNGGWLIVATYRRQSGAAQVGLPRAWFSPTLTSGSFRSLGDITLPSRGGRAQAQIESPSFAIDDGRLLMFYGGRVNPANKSVISVAEIGWAA